MGTHNRTHEDAGRLQDNRRDLEDVAARVQTFAGTLTVYVDQEFIAPKALPLWLAGFRHLEEHAVHTPETEGAPAGLSVAAAGAHAVAGCAH